MVFGAQHVVAQEVQRCDCSGARFAVPSCTPSGLVLLHVQGVRGELLKLAGVLILVYGAAVPELTEEVNTALGWCDHCLEGHARNKKVAVYEAVGSFGFEAGIGSLRRLTHKGIVRGGVIFAFWAWPRRESRSIGAALTAAPTPCKPHGTQQIAIALFSSHSRR